MSAADTLLITFRKVKLTLFLWLCEICLLQEYFFISGLRSAKGENTLYQVQHILHFFQETADKQPIKN